LVTVITPNAWRYPSFLRQHVAGTLLWLNGFMLLNRLFPSAVGLSPVITPEGLPSAPNDVEQFRHFFANRALRQVMQMAIHASPGTRPPYEFPPAEPSAHRWAIDWWKRPAH
jgi:hypothetical protein